MEFDIKIDYSDGAPFKIRQVQDNGDIFYRQIDPQDQQFFDYLSQTQKYQQIKRLDDQSQLLLTSKIRNETVIIDDIKQLNDKSDLFLVILIYDNQNTDYVNSYLTRLNKQQENIKQQYKLFKNCIVVIIINNRHEFQLKIKEKQQYFDDSSAKLLVNWDFKDMKAQIFILNSRQDSNLLNNLIYQGFAAHFQPKYLLVQEICYQITNLDDYFNKIPIDVVAIVPEKDYEKQNNNLNNQLMFQQYLLQYQQYIKYHSKQNTYYDSFNCFYNYEIAKDFLQTNVLEVQDSIKIQEYCYLNLQFCQQIYERNFQIIQKNRIEFNLNDQQNSSINQNSQLFVAERKEFQHLNDEPQKNVQYYLKALKFKKQMNYIQKQQLELNKLRLVQLVDYLQLSQYLFIIIMLPYYFIREQTDNQFTKVFISIIPGFIIVQISIILIFTNLIFCIGDPLIIGNYQKQVKLVIRQIGSKYYYHDYFCNNDKVQQLNESYSIEKGNLLFKPELIPDKNQQQYQQNHAILLTPKIITYPILWFQNKTLNFIVSLLNIVYYALIIYLLTYYIQNEDSIKQYISLLIAILIVIQLILSLQYKSRWLRYLFNQAFQFIQINIFNNIIESYTKSNQVEYNYDLLRSFIIQIFSNILSLITFIVVDYSNSLNGGVFLGILFFQMLKQFNYYFYIFINRLFFYKTPDTKADNIQVLIDNTRQTENEEKLKQKANEIIGKTYVHVSGFLQQPNESKIQKDKTLVRNENKKQQIEQQDKQEDQAFEVDRQEEKRLFQNIKSNNDNFDEEQPFFDKSKHPAKYQSEISGRQIVSFDQNFEQNKVDMRNNLSKIQKEIKTIQNSN